VDVVTLLMAACLAYIARWIYKAVRAGREGWAEGMAENNNKREQDARAEVYGDLTQEDWETLGLSRAWLLQHVGQTNYDRLMRHWYPDPLTHTAMDGYLARVAARWRGVH
jgi:hypothetical protein